MMSNRDNGSFSEGSGYEVGDSIDLNLSGDPENTVKARVTVTGVKQWCHH